MIMNSRRDFLKNTSLASAGLLVVPSFATQHFNENDKLNVGMIGVGLRGTNHLKNLLLR